MQWVPYPVQIPHQCWFLPAVNGAEGDGYIEGLEVDGLRAYISVEAVKQIATQMGWAPAAKASDTRLDLLREQKAELTARVAELEAALDAVNVLKRSREFTEARGPGRPRKERVAS
jgi:hypothetical protein